MATGGAVARDGRHLAVRTYTDAYVWPLTGSDVAGALAGRPVRVPLPDSPQGEAISFTADSRQLVVGSEGRPVPSPWCRSPRRPLPQGRRHRAFGAGAEPDGLQQLRPVTDHDRVHRYRP